ncbi:hypothetical protein [Streptomyces sp. WAC01280]|uniref:hypothetical protein n=1 Tax=Streptomyces sp. WAC01280 TaxID=2487424 RepID=UPI000F7744FC|nr:hypothetical protein [Streptomyces sp. WAC01280]RSS53166.1 hypothetical protein EF909_27045 [Streptomyces sp. WAC01280]
MTEMSREEGTPTQQGVAWGTEVARSLGLEGELSAEFVQDLDRFISSVEVGPQSAAYFAGNVTVASLAREKYKEPDLTPKDLERVFQFWKWLYNGLVRRV